MAEELKQTRSKIKDLSIASKRQVAHIKYVDLTSTFFEGCKICRKNSLKLEQEYNQMLKILDNELEMIENVAQLFV